MYRIESFLSARLFLRPQVVEDRIYFLSNLSGHVSLYAMNFGGSVPEPLLPPHLALQNPHLMDGVSFFVFPKLQRILVMLDHDGDENYQPMWIPISGGYPEPAFGDQLKNYRVHAGHCKIDDNLMYLSAESRTEALNVSFQVNVGTGVLTKIAESKWGAFVDGVNPSHTKAILIDGYSSGDNVLYLWTMESGARKLLYGTPLEDRKADEEIKLNAIKDCHFTDHETAIIFTTSLFQDSYGLGYMRLSDPNEVKQVKITGEKHLGRGELNSLHHLTGNNYLINYNIDGCSWVYEGTFDEARLQMELERVLVGNEMIANGVLEAIYYDEQADRYSLAFSTATSPTQIFTIEGKDRSKLTRHTNERVLGIPDHHLSVGEDASFTSFDGTSISARLYLPATDLGYNSPYPVVYYIHGGPQSQERPDFAWFSMPLIQFLTLNGFAVFVPNVRGSSGYGMSYMKQVDKDWGGQDRLDHVHAVEQILPKDKRLDGTRVGVVGRSYGGYMSLTQAARHPGIWKAAVDMFGPYDLITFGERIPETWKPYFAVALGDPTEDREFLVERSPRTHIANLVCPLLVIQGKNDPRVVERESADLVEWLRSNGKEVEYLVFENEGHDVLKFENRITCYNAITDFFKKHLQP